MGVDRPTFHEAWYRVAPLRPRLLCDVRVHRQHFRSNRWYVLENPANNQFSRLSEEAYRFIGLLNGRRTVSGAWRICNEQLGDGAPTQGEVIQLLSQLYGTSLLYVELPPDSEALFDRCRKRVHREFQSHLVNLLFVRIPLLDPDRFLERWAGVVGRVFSRLGLLLWLVLLTAGLCVVVGNAQELLTRSSEVLDPDNLILLYLSFLLIKVFHEFSHAFACKRFGRLNGNGGEVHRMGVMFLVFFPLPYVDASSASAFRNKWHRATVGMAGCFAELAVAAVAAIVWANTSAGTLHIIAYNVIFVAGVSTLLFNGNPLLRFDAYYVLTDILEIPNLAQRSRQYIHYLFKRHVWGLGHLWNPAHSPGECLWFVVYGIASTAYRILISIRILLFLNDRLPESLSILVPVLAFSAILTGALIPFGKFVEYLTTGAELTRNRFRAVASTMAIAVVLAISVGILRLPDHCRVEGIIEPAGLSVVHAQSDGFIRAFLDSQIRVSSEGPALIHAVNPALEAQKGVLAAERQVLEIRRRQAMLTEVAAAQILEEQMAALDEKIVRVEQELSSLHLAPPSSGTWVSPEIDAIKGKYVRRGDRIGIVANLDDLLIRSTAGQNIAALIIEQADRQVEIRANGRPELTVPGTIEQIFPAGQERLPSEALGYRVGGSVPVDLRDPNGTRAAEMFFEIRIRPYLEGASTRSAGLEDPEDRVPWLTGQRVVVRIRLRPKSLAAQLLHHGRQLFQRRFRI